MYPMDNSVYNPSRERESQRKKDIFDDGESVSEADFLSTAVPQKLKESERLVRLGL